MAPTSAFSRLISRIAVEMMRATDRIFSGVLNLLPDPSSFTFCTSAATAPCSAFFLALHCLLFVLSSAPFPTPARQASSLSAPAAANPSYSPPLPVVGDSHAAASTSFFLSWLRPRPSSAPFSPARCLFFPTALVSAPFPPSAGPACRTGGRDENDNLEPREFYMMRSSATADVSRTLRLCLLLLPVRQYVVEGICLHSASGWRSEAEVASTTLQIRFVTIN